MKSLKGHLLVASLDLLDPNFLKDDDSDLWEQVTKQITSSAILSTLKTKHVPDDPSMN